MGLATTLGWIVSAIFILVPVNWARLLLTGEKLNSTTGQIVIFTIVFWAIGSAIAYALVHLSKKRRAKQQMEAQALAEFKAQPLIPITPRIAILKPGEIAYGSISGELTELKTTGFSAGTAGVSVRVAKGVTLRSGAVRGRAQKGMVGISNGELVITNQRVIFSGDRKSFSINNIALLNTTTYTDGFGFSDAKTAKTIRTTTGHEHAKFEATLSKVLLG